MVVSNSIISSNDISKVSNMSDLHMWASVNFAFWIVMWSSGLAAFGEISELVNVESVRSWSEALNLGTNFGLASVLLGKLDDSFNT